MTTLGQRIKKLRKQKGFTLQSLAGEELTKGMLSLIENDKANPSMESLAYIAKRLGVDKNTLLEEVPPAELRDLLQEVETVFKTGSVLSKEELKKITTKIQPYIQKLPDRYESARLLEIYSRCSYHLHLSDWPKMLERAEEMYEGLHLSSKLADVHIFKATTKFVEHQYLQSLEMLQQSRKLLEERGIILDPLKKLDFDYLESILYSAAGDTENAKRIMEEAIAYSREQQIFYKISELYRLAGFQAMLEGDVAAKDYYVHKLRLFAQFADDDSIDAFADLVEAHYHTSFTHEYEKAAEYIEKNIEAISEEQSNFFLEKGKMLYGLGRYEEAFEWLNRHATPEHLHHPYDLSMNYEKDAYLALLYDKLDKVELARSHAESAKQHIAPMPDSPYKTFIMEVYGQLVK
ncbi:helix-turn-helix domain-containing protein [Planococcus salinus]|uniref:XRE family transcriptional regulator n=1 Tax=Planococcus salinus TaxID=1848460 RepID=A0A3M8P5Q8_9BACL|nr:helix-turn-helix transcriptional regulator [Planococcus salinus]RNF38554.1 XRE family transcriptional regulator [Planococcus salinus]